MVVVPPEELGQIDGKQYFVPWDWGFTSILYNTEQVDEVTSWDALFNEDYAGHVSMWNDGPGAVAVSSYINGWDETALTDDQLAQIEQDWIDQKPLNAFYWSGEYTDLCPAVQDGTIWVAYAWQGCYATALAIILSPFDIYLPNPWLRWLAPAALFFSLAPWFLHRARWRLV